MITWKGLGQCFSPWWSSSNFSPILVWFVQSWPICGGKNLAPPPKQQELLLTGYLHTHTFINTHRLCPHCRWIQLFFFHDTNLAQNCYFLVSEMTKSCMKAFFHLWCELHGYPVWNWICLWLVLKLKPEFVSIATEVRKSCDSWQNVAVCRCLAVLVLAQSTIRSNSVKEVKQLDWLEFGDTKLKSNCI